jgi:Ca2+-binding RTX toxin-like protein
MAKIDGTNGGDTLYGTSAADTINALGGNDTLKGFGGADRLDGGAGIDTALYSDSTVGVMVNLASGLGFGGSAAGDTLFDIENLFGSDHNDSLTGDGNNNALTGLGGNDLLKGAGGSDRLSGGDGADNLGGGSGSDVLLGDAGDDVLMGEAGGDNLNGGAGFDTAVYSDSPVGVVVSLITNSAALGDAQGDTFTFIENLAGSSHDDTLIGHNGPNVINGGSGSDTLKGYGADDTLRGEDGDDVIDGGTGADRMIGGLGNDTYLVDSMYDRITEFGGQGIDLVRTSVSYGLTDGADVEILEISDPNGTAGFFLHGNSSGNTIIGNNGNNQLNGADGADQMIGRGGNDHYLVDNANDLIIENGGQGNDTVSASATWTLTAGSDVEVLAATGTLDGINLTGNANGNVVRGNAGNNILSGRDGRDELTGLGGQDSFLFDTPLNAATNVDRITDFNVTDDTILLDQTIFSSSLGLGNISAGELVIGTAAQDANDRIIYNSSTGALFYDNDGVGGNAQVQFATLSTGLALTNLDFLVVA